MANAASNADAALFALPDLSDVDVHTAQLCVLACVLVPFIIDILAECLDRSALGSPLPPELKDMYNAEEYKTSQNYNKDKSTMGLIAEVFNMAIFLAFWRLGGFPCLDRVVVGFGRGDILTGVIYLFVLSIAGQVLNIPFSLYSTFVVEEKYGFNRSTLKTFLKDRLKGLLLFLVMGCPVLAVVLAFFNLCGSYAWLYVWTFITVFQLVLFFLMPVCILPLFLQMIPLPEGLVIKIDKIDKEAPSIFLKRIYYEIGEGHEGKKAWKTEDRQFQGKDKGAQLSLWCSNGVWKISEGLPGADGTVYAETTDNPASPELGQWKIQVDSDATEEANQLMLETAKKMVIQNHDAGKLRKDLLSLSEKLEYKCDKIFLIDGSTRSEHSNAFCTGFGQFRRICLFDTLLGTLSQEEIIAVLGHEIGHDKLRHVHKTLVIAIVFSFVQFWLLGQFIDNELLAHVFLLPEAKNYIGLVLFQVVWGTVEQFLSIPMTVLSRQHEHQADNFSIEADKSYGPLLGSGLKKLMQASKVNLTPHPLKVFLEHSHPPLLTRLRAMKEYQETKWGTGTTE